MFPFTYKRTYTIDEASVKHLSRTRLFKSLVEQFEEPQVKNSTIHFRFLKAFFKRHRWLDSGEINFSEEGKELKIDLWLNFITAPVIYLLVSAGLIVMHFNNFIIAVVLISILWAVHSLLYLWTVSTIKKTIVQAIKTQTQVQKEESIPALVEVKDRCPACGNLVNVGAKVCLSCGLHYT
jgi:hypothetical protein